MTCNSLNKVSFNIDEYSHDWLIDTGASISAIKLDCLERLQIPFHRESMCIKGIGGNVNSEGEVYLTLNNNGYNFAHKFRVFESLPCKTNGILGQDFLKSYRAVLNFEINTLQLTTKDNESLSINFSYMTPDTDCYLTVPARSESVHYLGAEYTYDCVVKSQELCDGVYIANTISRPVNGKVPVRILNTRDKDIPLSYFQVNVNKLNEYDICQFERPTINSDRVKKLFELLNLKGLHISEQISIENICAKYPDVFHLPGDKLGTTTIYQQTIELKPHTTPIYTKPYRLPHAQKAEIDNQIKSMLDDGIIEESRSPWSSPLLLVPKKSDKTGTKRWRVVIDYRKLNDQIQDDKFPLPNITDILDSLSGSMYYTKLDLYQGFYQAELKYDSRPYTAFTTAKNQYQMTRMPMGLKSSPSSFSRMMTIAMSGLNYDRCLCYQDDLVVFGRNLELHNQNLMDVFNRLRSVNLKLNPSKCQFLQKEILYLGHVVSGEGILPDSEKTRVLQQYPRPQNTDEVKRFVAFANYYRKFIPQFAEIALPLNQMCRKHVTFNWSRECEESFQKLKSALVTPPVLQYPDFSKNNEFLLQTDASGKAIGSVLCNSDGRPVAYASRSLNKAEINYPTIEKELLAIVWSVKYFRPYLYGRRFKIQTDHRPLVYLFGMRDPSSRLTKFRLQLEEYNFTIEYLKGASNSAADALSRIIISSDDLKSMNEQIMNVMTRAQHRQRNVSEERKTSNASVDNIDTNSRPDQPRVVEIIKKPKSFTEISLITERNLSNLIKKKVILERGKYFLYVPCKSTIYLNTTSRSSISRDELVRDLLLICKRFKIKEVCILIKENNKEFVEGLIEVINKSKKWSGPRLCIVKNVQRVNNVDDRKVILNDFHLLPTSGHAGIKRMSNNIKKFYFWPNLEKDVVEYVSKCDHCQKQKYSKPTKQSMVLTTTANAAFEKVFLDIVGPLPKDTNGYTYILTLQCELTKFTEAYPLQNKEAASVARAFVDNFILRYSIPLEIATDRGSEFMSTTMKEVCQILKIKQLTSTAYHHESIGALENTHKTMGAYLRINCNNKTESWSSWLPYWCFAYNNTVHTETKYTPHELVFGKRCILPGNYNSGVIDPLYAHDNYALELKYRIQVAQKDARDNLIQSKVKRKTKYDNITNPVYYNKGDYLLLKNPTGSKMDQLYLGPYKVLEDMNCNVKILKDGKDDIVHKNRTKHYNMPI